MLRQPSTAERKLLPLRHDDERGRRSNSKRILRLARQRRHPRNSTSKPPSDSIASAHPQPPAPPPGLTHQYRVALEAWVALDNRAPVALEIAAPVRLAPDMPAEADAAVTDSALGDRFRSVAAGLQRPRRSHTACAPSPGRSAIGAEQT